MGVQHMPTENVSTTKTSTATNSGEPLFVKRQDAKSTPVEDEVSPFGVEVPIDNEETDEDILLIEKQKEGKTPGELLDMALSWKTFGNGKFQEKLYESATDAYFRGVVFARGLVENPKFNPALKHTNEEYIEARKLCESMFTNLSLAHIKYAEELAGEPAPDGSSPQMMLEEGVRAADEALKLNPKSDKALYRRAVACSRVAQYTPTEALEYLTRSKEDFVALIGRAANPEARTQLQKVNGDIASLRKVQLAQEKKKFSFGNALGAIDAKPENIDGGTKVILKAGDGSRWFDDEWLKPSWPRKCVATVLKDDQPQSFTLADDRLSLCVRSMALNEESDFVFGRTQFKLKFMRFEIYSVHTRGLEKIFEEGYGEAPVALADVAAHFRVISCTGTLLFNSRWRCNISTGVEFSKKEDPEKPPICWIWGESCPWAPLEYPSLKQGGKSELRLAEKPPLLDVNRIFEPGSQENVMVGMDLKKNAPWDAGVIVFVELLRVSLPIESATDAAFCADQTIAQEEVAAAMLVQKEELWLAERRFRRAMKFSKEVAKNPSAGTRLGLADTLLRTALPVLDGGNVTSQELKIAQARVEEARLLICVDDTNNAIAFVCRARLRICDDDDFEQALRFLDEALKLDPNFGDAQTLFHFCKEEQYKIEHDRMIAEIMKAQQLLKNSDLEGLHCLELIEHITWDAIMKTKIGIEVKTLMSHDDTTIRKRAEHLLGRWQDVSKQHRPMW